VRGRALSILLVVLHSDIGFGVRFSKLANLAIAISCLSTIAHGQSYFLKPYQPAPGQTVVARSSSDASGGQISVMSAGVVQKGTSIIKRQRTFERRLVGVGPTAKLEYVVLIDQTYRNTTLGGKSNKSTTRGALTGQVVYGLRDDMNRWRLFLKGKTASNQQAVELVELESYENRHWFQANPVKVGDTWFIEPSFIRNFIERDMGPALIEASMTFKSVEVIDGEQTAVLTFSIKSP